MDLLHALFLVSFGFSVTRCNYNHAQASRIYRMVGGNSTEHIKFPYQVRVNFVIDDVENFSCGGSILDDYHVISAAHCFINTIRAPNSWLNASFNIVAGVTDLKKDDRTYWVKANVKNIHVPKIFNDSLQNKDSLETGDIAVLKLETPLNLTSNNHLGAVQLPKTDDFLYINETAVVTGYGLNKILHFWNNTIDGREYIIPLGETENRLYFANTTVLSNFECQRKWNDFQMPKGWKTPIISEKHICAPINQRNMSSPEGVCKGDSGSPLVYNGNVQIGVASNGAIGCAETERSAIYTRVSAFKDFIMKIQSYKDNNFNDPEILTLKIPR